MENPHPDVPHVGGSQVNQVVSHPSQPLTVTASDDRSIRFLDNRTGSGREWGFVSANEVGGGGWGWGRPRHRCHLRFPTGR